MTHIYVFNIVLFGACLYALWAGGPPERAIALIFLMAAILSYSLPNTSNRSFEGQLAAIDLVTWLGVTAIALKANRFWPLYESALQLITVAVHGVKLYQPEFPHWMYIATNGKLAYPTLILLAIGVARHRERVSRFGGDRAWSIQRAEEVAS